MMPSETPSALGEFVASRSESAFRELVRSHSPMVFATALRRLGGDRAAAEDVAQEVFTLLARKSHRLGAVVLTGWLHRQTCRRAANYVRSESRRKSREFAAAAMHPAPPAVPPDARLIARDLDDALLALPAADRDALVLRYFEGHDYRSVGRVLGLGEDAARKRVQRAVEKLGNTLRRKGIAAGTVPLGTILDGFGAPPVPVEMISRLAVTALKAGAAPSALTGLLKPALAGILATSLVSGTALTLRQPDFPAVSAVSKRPAPRDARSPNTLPESPSLDRIITEIRRIRSSPQTVLTALRLKVVLAKIQISQTTEFILLSKGILNAAERREIYQPLLERWWDGNPDAALTFMLEEKIGPLIKDGGDNYLLGELFPRWAERDQTGSEEWLLRNWDDAALAGKFGEGTYRNFLSMWISGNHFSHGDIDKVFAFASRMPTADDQARSISQLVGMVPMHSMWSYSAGGKDQWLRFYRVAPAGLPPAPPRGKIWKPCSRISVRRFDSFRPETGSVDHLPIRRPLLPGKFPLPGDFGLASKLAGRNTSAPNYG